MAFEARIEGIFIDSQFEEQVVMLKEKDGHRRVPIWIQMGEMLALALQLAGTEPPRPFAHDLIRTVLCNLQARVRHVVIADIVDHIYHARVSLTAPETPLDIDARPSDAILLALKFDAPIYVANRVADKNTARDYSPELLQQRLQQLRPEDFINFVR